jgi:hypothetical protein
VNLSLEVVDLLGLEVMEGFQSLPRRGLEVGGFLLGRTRQNGEGLVVEIDKFAALECEHAVGPSYMLSTTDRANLEARIRSLKAGGGVSIVGFYRSHTRKDFALTMEDLDLMSDYFSKSSMVFLLIHMQRGGPPMAGFSIWEGRNSLSMTPYQPFPFRKSILTAGGFEICDRTPASRPTPEKRAEGESPLPALPDLASIRSAAKRLLMPPETTAVDQGTAPEPPVPAAAPAPKILRDPSAAVLTPPASDSPSRLLVLGGMRLRWGWPLAASILLTALLTATFAGVFSRGGASAVSPRPTAAAVAVAPAPPQPAPPQPAPEPGPPSVAAAAINPPPEAAAAPKVVTPRADTPREPQSRTREYRARATPLPAVITAAPPAAAAASPERVVLPDPPAIAPGLPGNTALLSSTSEILKPRTPQISDPFVIVTVDRTPKPGTGGLLRKLPLVGKRYKRTDRADFVPPAPVKQGPTELPAKLRQGIVNEVPIDVRVYVDRTGKVEFAELVSEGKGSNQELSTLAVFSARRWEFSPAHLGDEPVPAEVVLRFRFGATSH